MADSRWGKQVQHNFPMLDETRFWVWWISFKTRTIKISFIPEKQWWIRERERERVRVMLLNEQIESQMMKATCINERVDKWKIF